ncbi:IS3 family transposase [Anaerocolumna aminovalerica]
MAKKKNNNKNTLNKEIKEDLVAERIKCKLKGLSPVQYRMQSSRVA